MRALSTGFIVLIVFLISCNNGNTRHNSKTKLQDSKETTIVLNDSVKKRLIMKGAAISKEMVLVLQKNLKAAIKKEGFDYAIDFCHKRAMMITDSMSHVHNVRIKRAAKKNRNSFNETTPKESDIYKQYVLNWLDRKPLRPQIIPDENGHPVYYSMIMLNNKVCLNCHGTVGKELPVEREAKIKKYYPDDKAVNFKLHEPRGMWAITFKEYKVKQN